MARADDAAPVPIDEEHFPDPQFREFILEDGEYDTDGDGALSSEKLAAVTEMDCSDCYSTYFATYGRRLYSLKGIEYFTSLTKLDCSENRLSELDLSSNTKLTRVDCWSNLLTSLDTSKNTELVTLCCDNNKLTSLNVRENTKLKRLDCYINELTSLKLPSAIGELNCSENQLTELDAGNNTAYLDLTCSQNRLTSLKLPATICGLDCSENQIASLDLSNHDDLNSLICSSNKISQLNVSGCENLRELKCSDNRLAQLDLSGCERLSELSCGNNQLTSLDLTMCYKTITLDCSGNAYTTDVEKGRKISLSALPGKFDATKASGWSGGTVSDGVLTLNDDAASVTYTYDCGYGQSATFTLNAGYAVSFDTGGGSKVDSQTVTAGGKASRPGADPTWAQHIFAGWYADEACTRTFDFENTAINAGTTVYAKWVEDTEAPVIDYIEDGRTYCAAQKGTVTDEHLGTVTVNGTAVQLGEDGSFTLSPAAGEQKVVATDRAGNSTTVTVTVNDGHTWGENWSHDATHHWHYCSVCGKDETAKHAGGTATCSKKAECEVCGKEYGKLDPKNHEHTETLPAKEATCTEDGLTEGSKCTDCGEALVEQQTVPATGHKGGTATCSKKAVCETCGKEYGELDPTNHEHTVTLSAKAATSTEDGLAEGSKCTDCGTVLTAQQTVPATGHTGGTATCSKKAVCETCGKEYGKLNPENHEALEHVAAKAATAEAEGNVEYWRCTGCSKLFSDAAGTKEIKRAGTVIPKLDPKNNEDGKTDGGNGGQNGGDGSNGGTTTKTTVTTVTAAGKAGSGLAQTGDGSAAAAPLALVAGLTALGAALIRSRRCDC